MARAVQTLGDEVTMEPKGELSVPLHCHLNLHMRERMACEQIHLGEMGSDKVNWRPIGRLCCDLGLFLQTAQSQVRAIAGVNPQKPSVYIWVLLCG